MSIVHPQAASRALLVAAGIAAAGVFVLWSPARSADPPGGEDSAQAEAETGASADDRPSAERFTGSLTIRQKAGSLYYQVYVLDGTVLGGYDTWRGHSTHYHRIVGGWYDGRRLVLLLQSTQDDFGDKWYSQAHHFEREGDQFVIRYSLHGFGETMESGEVYAPHVIDDISELPAEQVQRLATGTTAESGREPSPEREAEAEEASPEAEQATLRRRVRQLERENARLKELVAELLLKADQ